MITDPDENNGATITMPIPDNLDESKINDDKNLDCVN